MATATINTVYCVQVSTGTAIPLEFFQTLVTQVGEVLFPQSVNEVVQSVIGALGQSGLGSIIFGADDLYIKVDGNQVWPTNATDVDIDSGQTVDVGVSVEVDRQHFLQLVEFDGGPADDDDLGGFFIDVAQDQGQGQIAKLVKHEGEGSAYYVLYQVD